ncbi:MAG: DUF6760 family protein [Cyanophyceae cyanobacterium]
MYEEVAYVAYHFHWGLDSLLDLAHPDRQRWVSQIDHINQQLQPEADP